MTREPAPVRIERKFAVPGRTAAEWDVMFSGYEDVGVRGTSVIAYQDGEPVGCLMVAADAPEHAALAPGAVLADDEKLNMLAIGVLERARGRGVSYAMAAHALLELARRGRTHFSYTLVLDDNWASRRTGQGLGAEVCASLRAYRRLLRG